MPETKQFYDVEATIVTEDGRNALRRSAEPILATNMNDANNQFREKITAEFPNPIRLIISSHVRESDEIPTGSDTPVSG